MCRLFECMYVCTYLPILKIYSNGQCTVYIAYAFPAVNVEVFCSYLCTHTRSQLCVCIVVSCCIMLSINHVLQQWSLLNSKQLRYTYGPLPQNTSCFLFKPSNTYLHTYARMYIISLELYRLMCVRRSYP